MGGSNLVVSAFEKVECGNDRYFTRILDNGKCAVVGVFDGVGGDIDGGEAAETARSMFERAYHEIRNAGDIVQCLYKIQVELELYYEGATTATVAVVVSDDDGGATVHWASIGDSRVFVVEDGKYIALSVDECEDVKKNVITNWLGRDEKGLRKREVQHGSLIVRACARVVLVTDGVTGDFGSDVLSKRELVRASKNAEALIAASRKHDDGTAVVVVVGGADDGNNVKEYKLVEKAIDFLDKHLRVAVVIFVVLAMVAILLLSVSIACQKQGSVTRVTEELEVLRVESFQIVGQPNIRVTPQKDADDSTTEGETNVIGEFEYGFIGDSGPYDIVVFRQDNIRWIGFREAQVFEPSIALHDGGPHGWIFIGDGFVEMSAVSSTGQTEGVRVRE